MEHQLKIYPLADPLVHKRRPMTPDRRQALKERVFRWLKEGTIRKFQHPEWVANTIHVKLANGIWKVQVDYSSLNKVCAKDMYPFLEEGEELASVMEYPYKCFLRLLKENNQIRMAENDEQKTGFHTEEGVYCFTHMTKELKNSAATLQRMMEKVFSDQRWRNVEVYLEEIVVTSKSEQSLVHDVEEILRKLKRVNIKIDPNTSSFRVEEGKFLGYMVTKEGVRADPEKVQTIIRSPTPKSPNQIRSLFMQLTAVGKFIPKLTEPKYPINKISMRMDTTTDAGWTNEAKEAFQRIKREQVQKTPDANEGETSKLSNKLQAKLTPTPRARRLYLGKEAIEEVSGVGIILVSPDENMHSYAIRLKFNASDHTMDYEALLARLVVSSSKGMKDLHVFTDSLTLVAQIEGNYTPTTEQEKMYKEEIMDATAPFYRFWITHLLKILNSKTEVLTRLAIIKLEFLNQEVSMGIKTRPSVEVERAAPKVNPVGQVTKMQTRSMVSSGWLATSG
ncbi:reverse transcriptase domain-containing protein [Tanacetum coccineum]